MNILLTEIRSLNLELSGGPEVVPDTASSFTRSFQQQLPENSESGNQAVDYKGIYAEYGIPVGAPAETPEIPQAAAWREYLAQDPVRVSSDSVPLQATQVNLELIALPATAQAPQPVALTQSTSGEALPPGGKTLPDTGLVSLVSGSGQVRVSAAVTPPIQVPNPQTTAAELNIPGPASTVTATAAELPAQMTQPATIAASPGSGIDKTVALKAEPVPVEIRDTAKIARGGESRTPALPTTSEKPVMPAVTAALPLSRPVFDPGMHRPTDAQPLPGADLRQSPVLNSGQQTAAAQAVPGQPQSAAGPRSSPAPLAAASQSAAAFDPGQSEHRNPVNPDVSAPRASAPSDSLAGRAGVNPERLAGSTKPAAEIQPGRSAAVTAEMTAAGELRETPRIQLTQATQLLDHGLTQNTAGRAAEPALNVTAPAAPAVGVAPSVSVTPLTAAQVAPAPGETLPPQLEVLQLSRQANGNDWGNGLGERVQWMINQKQNSAMIRLDPPALGKLEVQVKIAEDSTTITIQTQHAQTRDLIETASHRLRDFLQDSGYQNVNVDVSHRHDQQQARAQTAPADGDDAGADADAEPHADDTRTERGNDYLQGDGLLDTFA